MIFNNLFEMRVHDRNAVFDSFFYQKMIICSIPQCTKAHLAIFVVEVLINLRYGFPECLLYFLRLRDVNWVF